MTAILIVALATLFFSFLCSTLEATLYSVTPSQLAVMARNGVFGAKRFARYREHVEGPIAAILTVNTIANTAGASLAGALVGDEFDSPWPGVFAGVFTFAVLLFAEIVPKSLGVRFGKSLVPFLIWPLQIVVWVSYPIAKPAHMLMRTMTRRGGQTAGGPTEEEIIAMSHIAARAGELTALEMVWVENALVLDTISAHDLMTPRTVVQMVPVERSVREVMSDPKLRLKHSRMPAYEGDDRDKLVGVVHRRDAYDALADGREGTLLGDLVRPLDYVPEGIKGPQLLEKFVIGKRHMVAVIDEYGGFEGIVTLEDVLECLIGAQIVDEHDEVDNMQELARQQAETIAKQRESDEAEDGETSS